MAPIFCVCDCDPWNVAKCQICQDIRFFTAQKMTYLSFFLWSIPQDKSTSGVKEQWKLTVNMESLKSRQYTCGMTDLTQIRITICVKLRKEQTLENQKISKPFWIFSVVFQTVLSPLPFLFWFKPNQSDGWERVSNLTITLLEYSFPHTIPLINLKFTNDDSDQGWSSHKRLIKYIKPQAHVNSFFFSYHCNVKFVLTTSLVSRTDMCWCLAMGKRDIGL